jgi:hypothetical protein
MGWVLGGNADSFIVGIFKLYSATASEQGCNWVSKTFPADHTAHNQQGMSSMLNMVSMVNKIRGGVFIYVETWIVLQLLLCKARHGPTSELAGMMIRASRHTASVLG